MEPAAAAGESRDPPPPPPPEDLSTVEPSPSSSSSSSATAVVAPGTQAPAPAGAREVAAAMEAVERDAAAIAESYASLFASLRVALSNVRTLSLRSNTGRAFRALLLVPLPFTDRLRCILLFRRAEPKVTSTSAENMECLGDVVGRLQESGEAARLLTSTRLFSRLFGFLCSKSGETKSLVSGGVSLQIKGHILPLQH